MRLALQALPPSLQGQLRSDALRSLLRDASRYFAVSLVALALDWLLLIALHRGLGWHYLVAAATSFTAGLAVAWALSIRFVFRERRRLSPWAEFGGFLATGFAGLVVNQLALMALVGGLALPAELAKAPVAGIVFTFNFVSRRMLLFAPDAVGKRNAPRVADPLGTIVAGVTAIAIILLTRPSPGIFGDAQIYMGRALADLDPAGVGRDMMFVLDGQSAFSVFTPIARFAVAHLSPIAAAQMLALAGQALWIPALCALCAAVGGARWAGIAAFAAILPAGYGMSGLLAFGEPLAEPRPVAEAFVLVALAAWLANRRLMAGVALFASALFHPIMALAGFATLGLLLLREHVLWRVVACLALLAVIIAAFAGLPLADRLLTTMDADWLGVLRIRNPYLFPDLWPAQSWSLAAQQALTIAIAARVVDARVRALMLAALAAGCVGVAAASVFGALWPSVLGLQLQVWRLWWLPSVLAAIGFGVVAVRFGASTPRDRVLLAGLALAWALPGAGPVVAPVLCASVLMMQVRPDIAPQLSARVSLYVWCAVVALVIGAWTGPLSGARHLFDQWQPGFRPHLAHIAFVVVQEPLIVVGALCLMTPAIVMRAGLGLRAVIACCLAIAAAVFWNDATSFDRVEQQGVRSALLADMTHANDGDVLWLGGSDEAWMWLHRPNWAARIQGAGIVFSRPLAMHYAQRAAVLRDLGIDDLLPLRRRDATPAMPDARAFAALCARDDAPVSIVAPLQKGAALPADWKATVWTAPLARIEPPKDALSDAIRVDDYAVILCSDQRPAATTR